MNFDEIMLFVGGVGLSFLYIGLQRTKIRALEKWNSELQQSLQATQSRFERYAARVHFVTDTCRGITDGKKVTVTDQALMELMGSQNTGVALGLLCDEVRLITGIDPKCEVHHHILAHVLYRT